MPSIGAYAIVLAVVAVTTFVALFGVRRLSVRIGAVVRPDARHVHERSTPTLGGVAMLLGVLVGMFTALGESEFYLYASVAQDET